MKLDKIQQKQLVNMIYIYSNKRGYKKRSNTIYRIKSDAFIHCDFLIVNSQKLVYRVYIKNYSYDDIFWNVMQMSSNSRNSDSLRAVGAFKAPSILLKKGELELIDKYENQADNFVRMVDESSANFMEQHDIDEYAIYNADGMNADILEYLAYVHMGEVDKAKSIAMNAIENGNTGNFVKEGKAFFEWALLF